MPGDSPVGYRLPLGALPYLSPSNYPYINPADPSEEKPPLPDCAQGGRAMAEAAFQASDGGQDRVEQVRSEIVGAEELADSQAYLTGIVPLTLETNEGVASALLNMEWHGLGLDYLQRYPSLINGVTAADVQRVAARYLRPENCVISTAGSEAANDEQDAAHRD